MKMWISRDADGELHLNYDKPTKHGGIMWINQRSDFMELYPEDYPEVTFENSPMEVEFNVKHSGMHLSPMFRLLDMIVIKDPSDRKRIVTYTKKLIDKLKEEGFDADARVAEEYLKMFNGESIAMATMDGSETCNK